MTYARPATGFAYLDDPDPRTTLAFAHRGGSYHPEIEGLENTLRAFAHAVALGYRYLETDVHLTADGVLLSFHDDVLDRVTDHRGAIADLTLAQVRAARIGGHEQVPTLVELFDAFPEARFNIDIKADGAVAALAAFVNDRKAYDQVLVGSFSTRRLREFRRLTKGRVPTSAAPLEAVLFRFTPSARLARFLTGGHVAALQVPHRRGPLTFTTAGLVRRAHRAGAQVHVWTIDDPREMTELLEHGVDGLMTDRTDLLKQALQDCGRWGTERKDAP